MSDAAEVIPVKRLALSLRIGMDHRYVAGSAMGDALKKRSARVRNVVPAPAVVAGQSLLHLVPDLITDEALVLAWIDLAMVPNYACIDRVGQKVVERGLVEWAISSLSPRLSGEGFQPPATPLEFLEDQDG